MDSLKQIDKRMRLGAEVYHANQADTDTFVDSVLAAQANLQTTGGKPEIEEAVADKGYHANATLEWPPASTFAPIYRSRNWPMIEPGKTGRRRSVAPSRTIAAERVARKAVASNANVASASTGSFAHVCDTGGGRRSWLRGKIEVTKRYRIAAAAHNLARIMRMLFGMGKPRALQAPADLVLIVYFIITIRFRSPIAPARAWSAQP